MHCMIKLFKKKQPVTEYLMQFKEFICNYKFHKTLSPRLFISNQFLKKLHGIFLREKKPNKFHSRVGIVLVDV